MKNRLSILLLLLALVCGGSLFAKSSLLNFLYDMFDQASIKPQEAGGMERFPLGSVSTDGAVFEDPGDRFGWLLSEMNAATATSNPVAATQESLKNGKLKFHTYCAVCHGTDRTYNESGFADTKVNQLGMIAPTLLLVSGSFPDGYLYRKMYYGGVVMPPQGTAITTKERWDIVHYIRLLEKN